MTPRGIANNNPGNIRSNATTMWVGLDDPSTDGSFFRFRTPVYGIRAMAIIQLNYQGRGVRKIGERIDTWAPPEENDDCAYENDVVHRMSVYLGMPLKAFTDIDVTDIDMMKALLKAITWHENGECPYDDDMFDAGIYSAYASHGLTSKVPLNGGVS